MANWNSNFEVMLERRPELRQELARYQLDAMVPMVQVMEWLRQFAGLSESIMTHARAHGSRLRDLEAQVEKLATTVDERRAKAIEAFDLMEAVTIAALHETDAEKAHTPDGSWPPGTLETLQARRRARAEAVERLREKATQHQLEAMAAKPATIEIPISPSEAAAIANGVDRSTSVAHPSDCTGCAACETAGA